MKFSIRGTSVGTGTGAVTEDEEQTATGELSITGGS
jgi:hypothetical protein